MAALAAVMTGHWRKLHTLGRGASGAVVCLAVDAASGELFAVKSAAAPHAAASLRRERSVLAALSSSPHIIRCVGGAEGADGSYSLFLEYAPGGTLADEACRNGGSLDEPAIRARAADVLRGLAYLHARSVVHGDVKPRNVVIGADGRAKLADFGCARAVGDGKVIGGTPAFMAPEVARGESQGPAADVWALGCTVVEMATGRAPWSGVADGDDLLAALHRIGHTDAVPEVPSWLSPEAKDFLARCFARDAAERWTAAELLEHPFVASACAAADDDEEKARRVSPKSTLDAAFWESESDSDSDDETPVPSGPDAAERIKSLACSAFPDWECDEEGWIDVLGEEKPQQQGSEVVQVARGAPSKVSGIAPVPAGGGVAVGGGALGDDDELETEDVPFGGDVPSPGDASVGCQGSRRCSHSDCHVVGVQPFQLLLLLCCKGIADDEIKLRFHTKFVVLFCLIPHVHTLLTAKLVHFVFVSDRPRLVPHSTLRTCSRGKSFTTVIVP